ncbi:MAG: hypothetical protein L0H64_19390, partial [Pseudonocardia sp.]|nr:hypothetical protein [Pseudonocardia sp.]
MTLRSGILRWGWVRAVALLTLLGLLAGCTVGPSLRPPVAVRGENLSIPAPAAPVEVPEALPPLPPLQPQDTTIPFVDCTTDALAALGLPAPGLRVECGELPVPVDPARNDLGSILLGVVRVSTASGPSDKPPLLALGDSVAGPTVAHAVELATRVSPALLEEFVIIGLDRRGAGVDRLDCAPPDARAALIDADPAATTEADLAALLERAREIVQDCTLKLSSALGGFGREATAVDVDLLRDRLGVAQLSAVGVGDGADALATWARAVPGGVGRLVLDGPSDLYVGEPARTAARAASAAAAFDAFALSCTALGDCPLGPDPRATVTTLVDTLRDRPLVAPDGRRLTAGGATTAILVALSEPNSWPATAAALAAGAAGDPGPLLGVLDPVAGPGTAVEGLLATACNDNPARRSPLEVGALAARRRAEH